MAIMQLGATALAQGGAKGDAGETNPNAHIVSVLSDVTGDQSANASKIWKIQGDIDLSSASITIPANVILDFVGGSIKNGTINFGLSNLIKAEPYNVFGYGNTFTGTITSATEKIYPDWFGAIVNSTVLADKYDNYYAYNACTEFVNAIGGGHIFSPKSGTYYFHDRSPVTKGWGNFVNDGYEWATPNQGGWGFEHAEVIIRLFPNTEFSSSPNTKIAIDGTMVEGSDGAGSGTWRLLGTYGAAFGVKNVKVHHNHFQGNIDIVGHSQQQHCMVFGGQNENIEFVSNKVEGFSGDVLDHNVDSRYLGGNTELRSFELGTINKTTGAFEASSDNVRTTLATPFDATHQAFQDCGYYLFNGGSYGQHMGVKDGLMDVYFYDISDNFLEVKENIFMFEKIALVDDTNYIHIVMHQTNTTELFGSRLGDPINPKLEPVGFTQNMKFMYNTCWNNGRQMYSVSGVQDLEIAFNDCKNTKGNPGGCIDIEDAAFFNRNINIHSNHFEDYQQGIIVFDGFKINIHDNKFKRGRGIISQDLLFTSHLNFVGIHKHIRVSGNTFDFGTMNVPANINFHNNYVNYGKLQNQGGTTHGNNYYCSSYLIEDDALTPTDKTVEVRMYNETFKNDTTTLKAYGSGDISHTIHIKPSASNFDKIYIDNIKILGNGWLNTLNFEDTGGNEVISNIEFESYGGTDGDIRLENRNGIKNLTAPYAKFWGANGIIMTDCNITEFVVDGGSSGTVNLVDCEIPTVTGTALRKFKYPNSLCPSYVDNATALAVLGEGFYYKDTTSGKFEVTIT